MVLSNEFRPVCVSARSKQLFPHRSLKGENLLCTVDADVVGTYSTFKALRPKNAAPIHGKLVNFRIHAWMEVFGAIADRERCGGCCCCSVSYVVVCALGFELPVNMVNNTKCARRFPSHTHTHTFYAPAHQFVRIGSHACGNKSDDSEAECVRSRTSCKSSGTAHAVRLSTLSMRVRARDDVYNTIRARSQEDVRKMCARRAHSHTRSGIACTGMGDSGSGSSSTVNKSNSIICVCVWFGRSVGVVRHA